MLEDLHAVDWCGNPVASKSSDPITAIRTRLVYRKIRSWKTNRPSNQQIIFGPFQPVVLGWLPNWRVYFVTKEIKQIVLQLTTKRVVCLLTNQKSRLATIPPFTLRFKTCSLVMEHFGRRRWTSKLALLVSYSVLEGKHLLFQLFLKLIYNGAKLTLLGNDLALNPV